MITVNGNQTGGYDGQALRVLLEGLGYPLDRVAVEMDGCIVPKAEYDSRIPEDGSHLEIVCFVGGG